MCVCMAWALNPRRCGKRGRARPCLHKRLHRQPRACCGGPSWQHCWRWRPPRYVRRTAGPESPAAARSRREATMASTPSIPVATQDVFSEEAFVAWLTHSHVLVSQSDCQPAVEVPRRPPLLCRSSGHLRTAPAPACRLPLSPQVHLRFDQATTASRLHTSFPHAVQQLAAELPLSQLELSLTSGRWVRTCGKSLCLLRLSPQAGLLHPRCNSCSTPVGPLCPSWWRTGASRLSKRVPWERCAHLHALTPRSPFSCLREIEKAPRSPFSCIQRLSRPSAILPRHVPPRHVAFLTHSLKPTRAP